MREILISNVKVCIFIKIYEEEDLYVQQNLGHNLWKDLVHENWSDLRQELDGLVKRVT